MEIKTKNIKSRGIKYTIEVKGMKVGRAFLYIMHNDLHQRPFGLIEDVFVSEKIRGQGVGQKLIGELLQEAKNQNCYKVIATSRNERPRVQKFYKKLRFKDYGKEFRIDL